MFIGFMVINGINHSLKRMLLALVIDGGEPLI